MTEVQEVKLEIIKALIRSHPSPSTLIEEANRLLEWFQQNTPSRQANTGGTA